MGQLANFAKLSTANNSVLISTITSYQCSCNEPYTIFTTSLHYVHALYIVYNSQLEHMHRTWSEICSDITGHCMVKARHSVIQEKEMW